MIGSVSESTGNVGPDAARRSEADETFKKFREKQDKNVGALKIRGGSYRGAPAAALRAPNACVVAGVRCI